MTKDKKYSQLPATAKSAIISQALLEHKCRDIAAFSLPEGDPLAEIVIICSATSSRHARSLADAVSETCRENKFEHMHTEGYQEGEWILVDLNDIILHIFLESTRSRYKIEELLNPATPLDVVRSTNI